VRDERYASLRGFFHGLSDEDDSDGRHHIRLHSVILPPSAAAIGECLGDLGLALIGVEVTAVRRRNIRGDQPTPELVLAAHDIVVLRGAPEALSLAEQRLLSAK
jgi:CPA2 family monovalent cation:H+ antiporter-2